MKKVKTARPMSLLGRAKSRRPVRFNESESMYPPAYKEWLLLKGQQKEQDVKLLKVKRRRIAWDSNLNSALRLCEIKLLSELATDINYKVPKDAIRAIAGELSSFNTGTVFSHWSFKPSRSRAKDSDPLQLFLKGLAVVFIRASTSESEKDSRRDHVADSFGIDRKHKKAWENQVEEGAFSIDQFSNFPYVVDEILIEGAGVMFQKLKKEKDMWKESTYPSVNPPTEK